MTGESVRGEQTCPQCGGKLRQLPTLGEAGYLVVCTDCDYEGRPGASASTPHPAESAPDRFRKLLKTESEATPIALDEESFEEMPPEAKSLLAKPAGEPKPPTEERTAVTPDWEERLRRHGYYLHTDHTGPRLTGSGPKPGTGDLTPLDVVRLAADLEGGIPSPQEKVVCPHCQAATPSGRATCQWCGGDLSQPAPSNPGDS